MQSSNALGIKKYIIKKSKRLLFRAT
jgi:hypothetical protein